MRLISKIEKAGILPALGLALSVSCSKPDHFIVVDLHEMVQECHHTTYQLIQKCLNGEIEKKDCHFSRTSEDVIENTGNAKFYRESKKDYIQIKNEKDSRNIQVETSTDEQGNPTHLECEINSSPTFNDDGELLKVRFNKSSEGPMLKTPEIRSIAGTVNDNVNISCSVVPNSGVTTCTYSRWSPAIFRNSRNFEIPANHNKVHSNTLGSIDYELDEFYKLVNSTVSANISTSKK